MCGCRLYTDDISSSLSSRRASGTKQLGGCIAPVSTTLEPLADLTHVYIIFYLKAFAFGWPGIDRMAQILTTHQGCLTALLPRANFVQFLMEGTDHFISSPSSHTPHPCPRPPCGLYHTACRGKKKRYFACLDRNKRGHSHQLQVFVFILGKKLLKIQEES